MPFINLPINQPLYQNVDQDSLSMQNTDRHDVFMDESGSMRRRPGLENYISVGSGPINGIYYWQAKNIALVASGKDLYKIEEDGSTSLIASGLLENNRAIFDEAINPTRKVFVATGGIPVETDGDTASKLSDSNAPQDATHLTIFDTYLLASKSGTQKTEYSVVGQPEVFNAEFFTAETQSDDSVGVFAGWDEITVPGKKTWQFFYNDGVTPFVNKPGAIVQQGCISPYSIKLIDNAWFFLNRERKVVRLTGRQPQILSVPIDRVLSGIDTIDDAIGDHLKVGGRAFYVLTFPSAGKTIAYDYQLNQWAGEWGSWNKNTAKYGRWASNYIKYIPEWNQHLVGDYSSGNIYKASFETYQDNGQEIRTAWTTGYIDHNTDQWKKSLRLRLRIKRGEGDINTEESPKIMVRYRDNGEKKWGNTRNIDLGKLGDYEFYKEFGPLGRYRSRQYEIYTTSNVPLTLVSVSENVMVVENA